MTATKDTQAEAMIMVMGLTGAGKSYFINQLAGEKVVEEGPGLEYCTQDCQGVPVNIGNSKVLLIDTPGFDDTKRTDSEILTEIARILSAQHELGVQLKGVVYIHRITDIRSQNLDTSRWKEIEPSLGAERERQLKDKFWAYMVGNGSNTSRFHGDRDAAISLVSQLMGRDEVVLQLQRELVVEKKNLSATVAGSFVDDNLEKQKQQVSEELASLDQLKKGLLENDRAMRRQIMLDWEQESARLKLLQNQQVSLQRPIGAEIRQEIQRRKSSLSLSKVKPYVPTAISLLAAIVGVPPGVTKIVTKWFTDAKSS